MRTSFKIHAGAQLTLFVGASSRFGIRLPFLLRTGVVQEVPAKKTAAKKTTAKRTAPFRRRSPPGLQQGRLQNTVSALRKRGGHHVVSAAATGTPVPAFAASVLTVEAADGAPLAGHVQGLAGITGTTHRVGDSADEPKPVDAGAREAADREAADRISRRWGRTDPSSSTDQSRGNESSLDDVVHGLKTKQISLSHTFPVRRVPTLRRLTSEGASPQ